jgi:hypothetical protein
MKIPSPARNRRKRQLTALQMTPTVYEAIRATVGSVAPETGGMLGGDPVTGVVSEFYFDHTATQTKATYAPNHSLLTRVLEQAWNPAGIRLLGFVHSHPRPFRRPSYGDELYAKHILAAIPDLDRLALPIVFSASDGGPFELLPFAVSRNPNGVTTEPTPFVLRELDHETKRNQWPFARVRTAYDLDLLRSARIVAVGCGGAAEFLEWLVRAGVGEFVLIDPDIVTVTNLATQQTYRRDIGRLKVEAIAERMIDINPNVRVKTLYVSSEQLSDRDFGRLLGIRSVRNGESVSVLCGMTDAFAAQARVNRLALQFSVPSLCAQVYGAGGRAAEVTFTHPDTTPACHRCLLRSRYDAYLHRGFRNDVTSDGVPIGSTSRLNALKFFIAMALLHHGTEHPRWGRLLQRIGTRNLIQLRMHPDVDLPVFDRVFAGADRNRILCDDAVWLPQRPDHPQNGFPACPDCGGKGDLRSAAGTFRDTREMRK